VRNLPAKTQYTGILYSAECNDLCYKAFGDAEITDRGTDTNNAIRWK
jgi:hypothetical protein